MSVIQLLHGTDHIIEVPDIHIGNPHNDYGMGFYCTRVDEMAREWACKKNTDGFVNSYDFDTEGLKVLNPWPLYFRLRICICDVGKKQKKATDKADL